MEYAEEKSYTIKIQNFEGPFDLLFHLIDKNKISVYDIPINIIADQFIDYLKEMREMDLEITSEFLVMAATLLHIKSRMLIPDVKTKGDEENDDPRDELVSRLLEYRRYKGFTQELRQREREWGACFYKTPEFINVEKNFDNEALSPDELIRLYNSMLERNAAKMNSKSSAAAAQIVQHEKVTIKGKMKEIMGILMNNNFFRFSDIFTPKTKSRVEIATGFLAILELSKLKKANISQRKPFSAILVSKPEGKFTYEPGEYRADL